MQNINAFRPVVHEENIFKDFYYVNLCKKSQPLYLNKLNPHPPKHVSFQVWLKLA